MGHHVATVEGEQCKLQGTPFSLGEDIPSKTNENRSRASIIIVGLVHKFGDILPDSLKVTLLTHLV